MKNREPITVIGMSDMHGYLIKPENMPPGDVLCICGDIVPLENQSDTIESIAWLCGKFFPWVEALPYDKVVLVPGNHDFVFQTLRTDKNGNHRKPKRVMKKLMAPAKLAYLVDTELMYKGYRFYGSPWCPDLTNWAFYADDDQLDAIFSKIPGQTDVLVTHCPPRVMEFGMTTQGWNAYKDFGCEQLRKHVYEKKPTLHIFGHVHTGRHARLEMEGTTYANVSIKDEDYQFTYDPQVFKLV